MTMKLGTAIVEIDGDDSKLSKSLDGAKQKAQGFGGVMKTALGTAAGFAAAQVGIQGVAGAFDFLVGNAMEFEAALDGVQAATGATEDSMASMRKEALKIGKETSKSASEAVTAMGELAKAGMDVETILNGGAKAAVNLAEATGIDVPQAAVLVSNSLNTWKGSGMEAADAANILAKAANASAIDVNDLGLSLAAVGPVASASGLSMEDFATAIGLMGNNAMRGSDAGTSLKAFLAGLTPVSDKAKDSMAELGFRAFDLQGNFLPMPQIIANLSRALEGLTEEQRAATLELWFGSDGVRAANILLKEGTTGWNNFTQAMAAAPDVAEQARIRMGNLKGQMEQLKGSLETISITLGSMVLPYLTQLASEATKGANALLGWIQLHQSGIEGTLQAIALGIKTVFEAIRDLKAAVGDGEMNLAAALGLAALATMLIPGAPLILGIGAFILLIGTLKSNINELPTPLLQARLAFYELAQSIVSVTDILPDSVQKKLGLKTATDDLKRSIDLEIDTIESELEARKRSDAVTAMEVQNKRLATDAGMEYVDYVREQIRAYTQLTGPAQVADEHLRRLYESYIRNGGAAADLGFEVDALTGAISRVDAPAADAAGAIDGVTQSAEGLIAKGPSAQRMLRDEVGSAMADAARKAEELRLGADQAAWGFDNMGQAGANAGTQVGSARGGLDSFAEGANNARTAADNAAGAFRSLLGVAIDVARQAVNKAIEIKNAIESANQAAQIQSLQAQGYASGGVVSAGEFTIVGERGWEPFIPAVDGRILSHDDAMEALRGAVGGEGGSGVEVFMPNAQIYARDAADAERSAQDLGWGISTAVGLRG